MGRFGDAVRDYTELFLKIFIFLLFLRGLCFIFGVATFTHIPVLDDTIRMIQDVLLKLGMFSANHLTPPVPL